jgi:hypothetical protein
VTATESTSAIEENDGANRSGRLHPTAVLAIILVSYFMIILDISIVLTGLPQIRFGSSRAGCAREPTACGCCSSAP